MDRGPLTAALLYPVLGALLTGAACQRSVHPQPATATVEIHGETFTLELAADTPSRTRGLMGRTEIPAAGGMLFVFPKATVQSFWMGYCLVDMDLIFLDPNGRVTATHTMTVEPPRREGESEPAYRARMRSYGSVYPAQFAIELRAGSIDRLGVRFEDRVELDLQRLKAVAR